MAILTTLLIGGSAVLGATGIVTGVNGTLKISDAKKAIETADKLYYIKKKEFDVQKRRVVNELERLGISQKIAQASFTRFADAFERIQNRPVFEEVENKNVDFEDVSLDNIKTISIEAIDILGGSALSVVAGVATGAVAYGGTMTFGVASTGTAISALSGAAANNAALAALGGGAIKAGGGGMLLGKAVLGGAVAGPVIAVAGLLTQNKGKDSQAKAEETVAKVDEALILMNESISYMSRLRHLSMGLRDSIAKLYDLYLDRVTMLENLVGQETDYLNYTDEEKDLIDNNILIIKVLAHLTRLPLVKVDEENQEEHILTDKVGKEIRLAKTSLPEAF